MAVLAPIPLRLLPETMTVQVPDTTADYGGKFQAPVTICNVRLERAETLNPNQYRLADGAKGRVWIDAANSAGAFEVPVGSKVTICGEVFAVAACAALKPFGAVPHWELDVR